MSPWSHAHRPANASRAVARSLGCLSVNQTHQILSCLRNKSATEILRAFETQYMVIKSQYDFVLTTRMCVYNPWSVITFSSVNILFLIYWAIFVRCFPHIFTKVFFINIDNLKELHLLWHMLWNKNSHESACSAALLFSCIVGVLAFKSVGCQFPVNN